MSDLNQRAARGQAYNQACDDARLVGKMNDEEYKLKRFLYHLEMADLYQRASVDDLINIVK